MDDQLKLYSAVIAVRMLLVVIGLIGVALVLFASIDIQHMLSSFASA